MKKVIFLAIALLAGGLLIASMATAQVSRVAEPYVVGTLLGSNEVPTQGDPDGSGTAILTIDTTTGEICLTVSALTGVLTPITAGHIHTGAVGVSGGVLVGFPGAADPDGLFTSCVTDMTNAALVTADPAGYYINLHNEAFPDGAVRGQIEAPVVATPTSTVTDEIPVDTPTATATPTATTQGDTPTPTSTRSPTPTPTDQIIGTQLVVNGGFEDQLTGWTLKHATADKVKCNTETKIIAYQGDCAFKFKGSTGENSKLQQLLSLTGIAPAIGDTIDLSAYLHAKKETVSGKLKLVVKYGDTTASKATASFFAFPDGYASLDSNLITVTSADVTKLKLLISHKSPNGKAYIDEVQVLWFSNGIGITETPSGTETQIPLLPLP